MQKTSPTRFLVINPNTNALTTRRLQEVLMSCKLENVHLELKLSNNKDKIVKATKNSTKIYNIKINPNFEK